MLIRTNHWSISAVLNAHDNDQLNVRQTKEIQEKPFGQKPPTFSISPMLQTNDPGIGGADIHSPDMFLTFNKIT